MASKIHTDNPKHHKYTSVNKYERKKISAKRYNNIYNFIDNSNSYSICNFSISYYIRQIVYGLKHCALRFKYLTDYNRPYFNQKGCKIIFDDCNHKTYRVIKDGKYIRSKYRQYYGYFLNGVAKFKFK